MAAVSETPEVGEDVGPYRLLFRLGKGGMGEVWAAQRAGASGFSKEVALKLVPAGDTSSNTVVMFMDEARVTAALQHPAIVPTYDLGKAGEHAFIAMEIVRGPSLNVLLKNLAKASAPMSPALVAYIGERIASALAYAYERAELDGKRMKLVHRDVSPQNILLDLHGTVRLSDFGIARTTVQDHLSAVGTMRGKPGYMSPEQARGLPLDDRSDVFCLATVLWECAAVRRLFGGKDIEESIAACIQRPAPRLDELLGDFPAALAALIARGLAKDPALLDDPVRELRIRHEMRLLADGHGVCSDSLADVSQEARHVLLLLLARDRIGLAGRDRPADDLDSIRRQLDHDAAILGAIPLQVRVCHVIARLAAGRDVADLAGLVQREAGHAAAAVAVALRIGPAKADLCPPDVAVEVTLQIKGHLVVQTSEPHPARDPAGRGVVQLTFQ